MISDADLDASRMEFIKGMARYYFEHFREVNELRNELRNILNEDDSISDHFDDDFSDDNIEHASKLKPESKPKVYYPKHNYKSILNTKRKYKPFVYRKN